MRIVEYLLKIVGYPIDCNFKLSLCTVLNSTTSNVLQGSSIRGRFIGLFVTSDVELDAHATLAIVDRGNQRISRLTSEEFQSVTYDGF
jgi:hypothetical protein